MHPYLTRLGVRPEVQRYFRPFFHADEFGNLIFPYGDEKEHYGFAFHRVPITDECWFAGNFHFEQVRLIILSSSAVDAISWLNKKFHTIAHTQDLLFVSFGAGISMVQLRWLRERLIRKKYQFIFTNDLLGRMADVKVAAAIRGWPISVYVPDDHQIAVRFRAAKFLFSQNDFSLSAFEKAAGARFGIAVTKPKLHNSFFDELKAEAGL
ncbi:hypothetical protein [Mucilaginibacter aquariorum]|uniref:Uncharacterized protein n=1 Tax=Mucilaginibacter aquariorum TaxID=2967225 RepID=A0ABT1SZN0_9SPHI|nr:hypothetical protein [Mucilaginibacter aquariorum]MCQ6957665.1 hypothetical protein [Mucilaginibacter aquariorum]